MELHDRPYRSKGALALRTLMLLRSMYAPSARWHTVLTTYAISMAVCEAQPCQSSSPTDSTLDGQERTVPVLYRGASLTMRKWGLSSGKNQNAPGEGLVVHEQPLTR